MLHPSPIAVLCIKALWLVFVAIWVVSAFRTKRTVYRQPWRQFVASLVCGVACVLIANQVPWKWFLPPNPRLEACGIALCAAGIAFAVWARFTLGRNWSGLVTLKEDHELIQTGPYRFVRHPIYAGLFLAVFGTVAALLPSAHGLLLLVAIATAFAIKLRQEERLMLRQFPEAYAAYKARVPAAIIPFLF